MSSLLDTTISTLNAIGYYIKSAVSLLVSNPYLLGFSVILILTVGKSLKVGSLLNVRG